MAVEASELVHAGVSHAEKLIENAVSVAAKWWSDRLRESTGNSHDEPAFDTAGIARENLDRAVMLDSIMLIARRKSKTTAEHCDAFEKILRDAMTSRLVTGEECWRDIAGWDDGGHDLRLSVDYSPDHILLNSMRQAGVDKNMAEMFGLPHKTDMRVSARRVEVSYGYGAPWECIYGPVWGCTQTERLKFNESIWKASEEYREWLRTLSREECDEVDPILSDQRPEWQGPV